MQEADDRQVRRLRARSERPDERSAAEKDDEIPSSHLPPRGSVTLLVGQDYHGAPMPCVNSTTYRSTQDVSLYTREVQADPAAQVKADAVKYERIVREAGIKLE